MLIVLPATLLAGACGDNGQESLIGGTATPQYQAELPDPSSLRQASVALSSELLGKDATLRSGNAIEVDNSLVLPSTETEPGWAIYSFQPELAYLDQVQLLMDINPGNEYFAALADYGSNRWKFHGPFSGNTTLDLADMLQRSPQGNCHIAIITGFDNSAEVQKLIMHTETYWKTVTVDSANSVGFHSSLVETANGPAIAYYDDTNQDLLYAHSSTANGDSAADWSFVRVASAGNAGQYCSLAMVKGNPAISYLWAINADENDMMYTRSSTSSGANASDWEFKEVDLLNASVGSFSSLAVISGHPAVSYYNIEDTDLMYARSNNDTGVGATVWTPVKIHQTPDTDFVGFGTSLAEIDGKPHIAYLEFFPYLLWYARSSTAEGDHTAEWDYYQLSEINGVTSGVSLIENGGLPMVSFYDGTTGTMKTKITSSSSPATQFNWTDNLVDNGGDDSEDVGLFSSLAIIDGFPCLSYQDRDNNSLRFARSTRPFVNFDTDWQVIEVESGAGSMPNVGRFTSIAQINGHPAISYLDSTNNDLKYAILLPPS